MTPISLGFPLFVLIVMYMFGIYTLRNIGWVLLCLVWGALGFGAAYFVSPELTKLGMSNLLAAAIITPVIQQVFAMLGAFFVVHRRKLDNLVDGAVYGFAVGLGYSIAENVIHAPALPAGNVATVLLSSFSSSLVYATSSGIVGVVVTQFYFRHQASRVAVLLGGFVAAVGYTSLFSLLVAGKAGGDYAPAVYGIGGLTLVGLYITGQLRRILIQVGIERQRANSLLDIVIPIGIQLSTEDNFGRLLESMLAEARKFCKADAGMLYLVKEKQLELAVMHNDTLHLAMGGTASPVDITLPGLYLYDAHGNPNERNAAAYAALNGRTVNVEDAYETKEYDFSSIRAFDRTHSYQSISFLTIPLKGSEGKALGAFQLINALDSNREIIPFDKNIERLMESFSSLAAAALEGYLEEQRLRNEIQQLRIQIDEAKRGKQVDEITNSDYFKNLQQKAKEFRNTAPREEN
ncbi:MAG TPA: PrsW family glutamic-type intramembrane protease [Anaerolineales bacterium]|nr:PrsW family glutamic-type intramembrane protease [Anaerolineales bacterium]